MTHRIVRHATAVIAIIALPFLAHAAAGELMSVTTTTHMNVPGAPADVAGMMNRTFTSQQCVASAQLTDPRTWSTKGDCTANDVHRSATGVSAHLVCRQMIGDLDVHLLPGGAVHGTLKMRGTSNGMQMSGEQTFDARRVGSCDTARPAG